ncbi:hypothetical protein SAMN05216516_11332 [Izhakiella capsodis]|uniref:Type III secretion protein L n=1 Tax=Izhakiella capsodis TaxID=1367852 RepID=A0A1I5AUP0_9GAMM|nr:type III secretion protein [Izhakiella capsodis]SFN66102.1 hypothetical protein SAMN05216516_11332 [Izhakiella capsodis]
MRTITIDKLPQDLHHQVIIKTGERTRYQRMAQALERTLSRCREINAENELQIIDLRKKCEKQGFEAGFQLFFSQLVTMIDEYQQKQNQRQEQFQQHVIKAINKSLNDPIIVNRIIHQLQEQCGLQKPLYITIPSSVKLPDGADTLNYQYTDDNHITVESDKDVIRFPSDSLCQQWLQHAEENVISLDDAIKSLSAEVLRDIARKLTDMSNQLSATLNKLENKYD